MGAPASHGWDTPPTVVHLAGRMNQQATNWDHCLEFASLTDVGLRRANNQDSLAVVLAKSDEEWRKRGHLFMVADGMGAHAAGELASKLATDVVPLSYRKQIDRAAPEALLAAVEDANRQINARGQASEDFKGMGTTINTLVLLPEGAVSAHVGDSRTYRWRANRLEQLTFDHSLVWELRAARHLSEDQVPSFIPKNVITRSLGPNPEVKIDLEGPFPVQVGDTFLLCSDGLSGPVEDDEMGTILGCLPPGEAVRALVDLANLRGGPDNITVVVARVTGPEMAQGGAAPGDRASVRAARRSIPPLLWALLGGSALGAVGLGAVDYLLPAAACLVLAAVAGIAALAWRYGGEQPAEEFDGQPLGKGPYTACTCEADAPFVERLVDLTHQLRDAAIQEDWNIDWSHFNGHHDRAVAAAVAADYDAAVREHCHVISFMMGQLKSQRGGQPPDDSGVL